MILPAPEVDSGPSGRSHLGCYRGAARAFPTTYSNVDRGLAYRSGVSPCPRPDAIRRQAPSHPGRRRPGRAVATVPGPSYALPNNVRSRDLIAFAGRADDNLRQPSSCSTSSPPLRAPVGTDHRDVPPAQRRGSAMRRRDGWRRTHYPGGRHASSAAATWRWSDVTARTATSTASAGRRGSRKVRARRMACTRRTMTRWCDECSASPRPHRGGGAS